MKKGKRMQHECSLAGFHILPYDTQVVRLPATLLSKTSMSLSSSIMLTTLFELLMSITTEGLVGVLPVAALLVPSVEVAAYRL